MIDYKKVEAPRKILTELFHCFNGTRLQDYERFKT